MVDGRRILIVYVVLHFMATDTELHFVGGFHGRVESAPEYNACKKEHQGCPNCCAHYDSTGKKAAFNGCSIGHGYFPEKKFCKLKRRAGKEFRARLV